MRNRPNSDFSQLSGTRLARVKAHVYELATCDIYFGVVDLTLRVSYILVGEFYAFEATVLNKTSIARFAFSENMQVLSSN